MDPTLDDLIRVASSAFVDLGALAPEGLLDIPLDLAGVRSVRLESPDGHAIRLQSIGIDGKGLDDLSADAQVQASMWRGDLERTFDPGRLFDFDFPTGTRIDTGADHPAWVEVRFARPVTIQRLRFRNTVDAAARGAQGFNVAVSTRWRTRVVYDAGARLGDWLQRLAAAKSEAKGDLETTALLDVLDLTVRGEYGRAHRLLAARVADPWRRQQFRAAVNHALLPARGLEWTVHGPQRPFRLWSDEERVDYVRDSAGVVDALRSLTPDVCLGFGSVLSVVRDHALIPHDDDLDIVVAFEPEVASTLTDALRLVEEHLRPKGYEVSGAFAAHRHVRRPGRKRVDVFVGIFEGETISWYPGTRRGLTRAIVFPPGSADLLGVRCSIPAQPELYLERLYGPDWRVPDPYFSHAWNVSTYADISGAPASEADKPAGG